MGTLATDLSSLNTPIQYLSLFIESLCRRQNCLALLWLARYSSITFRQNPAFGVSSSAERRRALLFGGTNFLIKNLAFSFREFRIYGEDVWEFRLAFQYGLAEPLRFCYLFLPMSIFVLVLIISSFVALSFLLGGAGTDPEHPLCIFLDEKDRKVYRRKSEQQFDHEEVLCLADDILEVHQHWYAASFEVREELFLLLRNSKRKRLISWRAQGQSTGIAIDPENQVEYVAERIARFAKCPIRFVRGPKPPPLPAGLLKAE